MNKHSQGGFIKYIVLFIIVVVLIAVFDIDVKKIVEHPFVQSVWHYIKVVVMFIRDSFGKVFGEFQTPAVEVINSAVATPTSGTN